MKDHIGGLQKPGPPPNGGTGQRLGDIVIIVAGVAALTATLLTFVSVWLQCKNYRKPLLQRHVVRILVMVPIYSAASWVSLVSLRVSFWIDPFRDVYEAFTIYAFFQLLINFIGGERALIIMMTGRPPVSHLWPLNHCLPKVDISDPYTFLMIKRGILQYTWLKPLLAIATIVMKATGTYQEGYIGLNSGYFWSGLLYNVSITISLYALAMFWICMSDDLKPFRPMPKFLCIKGIIFASYWQGFLLSLLVFAKLIPDNIPNYTPDNLAASIQDALICFEMPGFAIMHWYAFSWHDYADKTISAARMPVKFAVRDAFGPRDLIEDAKETFAGSKYDYRQFDAGENVIAHEDSRQRVARLKQGMRYARNGKGKYWLPKPGQPDSKTPLLGASNDGDASRSVSPDDGTARSRYGAAPDTYGEWAMADDDERLYTQARAIEFGDWNYPVITAHFPSQEDRLHAEPAVISAATNRHVLQPTQANKTRNRDRVGKLRKSMNSQDEPEDSNAESSKSKGSKKVSKGKGTREERGSSKSDRSQLVDLVVEDEQSEEIERVRARKEGSADWNRTEARHFIRANTDEDVFERVRERIDPETQVAVGEEHVERIEVSADDSQDSAESHEWSRESQQQEEESSSHNHVSSAIEEENVWNSPRK